MFLYLFRAFKIIYNIKKSWVYYTLFLRITVGILPLLELWIFQSIIDQVTIFITTNNDELSTLIGLICLQFGVLILRNIINEYINFIDIEMEQLLNHHMGKLLINKLQSVPYFFFEIPSFYNHLHRIRNNYATRFLRPIKSGLETVQNLITIASYLGFLFSVHWLLVIMGFAVAIPTFVIQYKFGGFKFNIYKSYSGKLRESNYINSLMGEKQSIKEIKLNSLENYLLKKWEKIILSYNKDYLDVTNKQRKANIKLGMLSSFLYVLGSILTIYIINNQRITIGQFVTVIQALKQLQDSVNHTAFLFASLLESGMYIKDFIEFIDYEEENQEKNTRITLQITVFQIKSQ